MKNLLTRLLVCALPLALIAPATAATLLNVTNSSEVTLNNNDSLLFYISNSSQCQFFAPTELEMIVGSLPVGGAAASIRGTSDVYFPGWLFSATLESADGSLSIPLSDPDATRLGLPAGTLVLTPGSRNGGSYSGSVDLVSGDVTFTAPQFAELFASGEAVIDLRDIGSGITFGYPGTLIGNDFSASLISHGGEQSEGARVVQVDALHVSTPEPGTMGLLLIGAAIIAARVGMRRTTEVPRDGERRSFSQSRRDLGRTTKNR